MRWLHPLVYFAAAGFDYLAVLEVIYSTQTKRRDRKVSPLYCIKKICNQRVETHTDSFKMLPRYRSVSVLSGLKY